LVPLVQVEWGGVLYTTMFRITRRTRIWSPFRVKEKFGPAGSGRMRERVHYQSLFHAGILIEWAQIWAFAIAKDKPLMQNLRSSGKPFPGVLHSKSLSQKACRRHLFHLKNLFFAPTANIKPVLKCISVVSLGSSFFQFEVCWEISCNLFVFVWTRI